MRVEFSAKADRPCAVPGIGEFQAGETKVVTDEQLLDFRAKIGYPLGQSNFPRWLEVTATLVDDAVVVPEEVPVAGGVEVPAGDEEA